MKGTRAVLWLHPLSLVYSLFLADKMNLRGFVIFLVQVLKLFVGLSYQICDV